MNPCMSITRSVSQMNCAGMRKALLPLCVVALFATACGQRGPLYLPAQEPPAQPASTEPAPADTTPDEADDADEENDGEAGRD